MSSLRRLLWGLFAFVIIVAIGVIGTKQRLAAPEKILAGKERGKK